jgi:hypothetical protein
VKSGGNGSLTGQRPGGATGKGFAVLPESENDHT